MFQCGNGFGKKKVRNRLDPFSDRLPSLEFSDVFNKLIALSS